VSELKTKEALETPEILGSNRVVAPNLKKPSPFTPSGSEKKPRTQSETIEQANDAERILTA
jgi:hypothetical protein